MRRKNRTRTATAIKELKPEMPKGERYLFIGKEDNREDRLRFWHV